jgi:hypothetical protein
MPFSSAPREKLAERTTSQKILSVSSCIRLFRLGLGLFDRDICTYRQFSDNAPIVLLEFVMIEWVDPGVKVVVWRKLGCGIVHLV